MRHQKSGRKFSRTSAHRNAMFSNMLASLITHERIETTVPKAKELRTMAEKTISWGMSVVDMTAKPRDKRTADERARIVHAMRMAKKVMRSDDAVSKLFGDVAARFKGRPGGYTRILKTRIRRGDAAPMALIELVVRSEKAAEAPAPVVGVDENEPVSAAAGEVDADEKPGKPAKKKAAPKAKKPAKDE
jgi:large subunit ribosomal protein L17